MRRGRPVKSTTPTPQSLPTQQPITLGPDPFVKLGSSAPPVQFEFASASEDDDISMRYPTIEELSGGAFRSSTPSTLNRSKSQPPPKSESMEDVDALADDAFALPIQPYRSSDVAALADDAFKADGRPSAAAQIRAALEREKSHTEYVAPMTSPPTIQSPTNMEEEERTMKPSEVIARGGVYTNQVHLHPHPPHSLSAPPPSTVPSLSSLASSTEEPPPDAHTLAFRRKMRESRWIIDQSKIVLDEQWPEMQEPVAERPSMVSTGTMTSPPPSPPKEILQPKSFMGLPSPKLYTQDQRSPGLSSQRLTLQETELTPRSKTPQPNAVKSTPQKEYIRTESPRPPSRGGPFGSSPPTLGKGLPRARPQSLYVDNDLEFLRSYDGKYPSPLEKSHTGLSTASQPASLPSSDIHHMDTDQDLDFLRKKDEEFARERIPPDDLHRQTSRTSIHGRRSSSSGPAPSHHRQTSLSALSKGIMSGKFGDAFRKFEGFSHHDPKVSESRFRAEKTLAKVSPDESESNDDDDWRVETHDIPVKMQQHLNDTRKISAERERTAAQERHKQQPSLGNPRASTIPHRAVTTSSRARMIQQRMNDLLNAQNKEKPPPLTADGYGPYITDARVLRNPSDKEDEQPRKGPGIMPKPNLLRRPSLKGSVDM
jgi:hypothetical protein